MEYLVELNIFHNNFAGNISNSLEEFRASLLPADDWDSHSTVAADEASSRSVASMSLLG